MPGIVRPHVKIYSLIIISKGVGLIHSTVALVVQYAYGHCPAGNQTMPSSGVLKCLTGFFDYFSGTFVFLSTPTCFPLKKSIHVVHRWHNHIISK